VAVASVTRGDIPITIPALGTVTPLATVTVKSQIAGQLTRVAFQEGQMVRAGDFLAQIDPRPYQAALDQAQANLKRDQALLANSMVDLQRYRNLIKEDAIAQQQLDTQESLVAQYAGTVGADQAAIETARVNLAYTHITSPISGRVGLRQIDAGNYVTPQDTNGLVVVTELQPISVIFPIPEDYMRDITARLRDGESLPVSAFDRTNTTKIADGRMQTIDNVSDPTTGTVKLRALFDNKDGALFANQFVNVRLQEAVLHDQLIVPTAGVHHGSSETATFAYVVNRQQGTVAVRPITLGATAGDHVAVNAGLAAGEIVVTEGADRLRDGAKVTLPAATPPARASTTPGSSSRSQ
jgi:multidrug efflux system membrane fusion protein